MRRAIHFLLVAGLAVAGIVPPDAPIPPPGAPGAPHRELTTAERDRFVRGRALFDRDFPITAGVGPHLNGDSCRACHQDPVIGGAGGIDVQVQRPAISDGNGGFIAPVETGELAQTRAIPGVAREEIPDTVAFVEERNSPTLLGLGLLQSIPDAVVLAGQDPNDDDGDGIRGIAHVLGDGSVGKLGWKANVPDVRSFVRDALSNEMGVTVPDTGNVFGDLADADSVPDPEIPLEDVDDLAFFVELLDFAPHAPATDETIRGGELFGSIGCAKCHVPALAGVEAFTDLLLHDVMPAGFQGVTQGQATSGLYRTAPLRGLRATAPYFHDGRSETIEAAIRRHDGEALAVRTAFEALSPEDQAAIVAFLESL